MYQKILADTTQMYEKKIEDLTKQLEDEHARLESAEEQLDEAKNLLSGHQKSMQVSLKIQVEYSMSCVQVTYPTTTAGATKFYVT